jgi:hypothetical protein
MSGARRWHFQAAGAVRCRVAPAWVKAWDLNGHGELGQVVCSGGTSPGTQVLSLSLPPVHNTITVVYSGNVVVSAATSAAPSVSARKLSATEHFRES